MEGMVYFTLSMIPCSYTIFIYIHILHNCIFKLKITYFNNHYTIYIYIYIILQTLSEKGTKHYMLLLGHFPNSKPQKGTLSLTMKHQLLINILIQHQQQKLHNGIIQQQKQQQQKKQQQQQ